MVQFFKSPDNQWIRERFGSDDKQPISFRYENRQYKKLNKTGKEAAKGDHKTTIFMKGSCETRPSTMKRYCYTDPNQMTSTLLVKTYKLEDKANKDILIRIAKNMMLPEHQLAFNYIIRETDKYFKLDIIMPFFEGRDLFYCFFDFHEALNKNLSDLALIQEVYEALTLMIEAIKALNEFHEKGWVHFDVKLENLFYDTKKNKVHVIDLDFSYNAEELKTKKWSEMKGSPEYVAPEIMVAIRAACKQQNAQSNDGLVATLESGKKADIFSMGMVLAMGFKLYIDGERFGWSDIPIFYDNEKVCVRKLEGMKFDTQYAQEIYALIKAMLSADPEKRPTLQDATAILQPIAAKFKERIEAMQIQQQKEVTKINSTLPLVNLKPKRACSY